MHDLLTDRLIGVRTREGGRYLNLPELMAALAAGTIEGYTGLRAHQADPWHVFLVQIAASIQAREPTETLPTDPGYWRDGMLNLADGLDTAWHLVVEDVTQPAFLQHPWGVGDEINFKPKAAAPDELDVLVTSKNHDVKMARIGPEALEAWIYALVLLQTTSGVLGRDNYGIIRMNGGYGSRPIVAWARSLDPCTRFADETNILKNLRAEIRRNFGYQERGVVLTWLRPWLRKQHQFQLTQLEPWFIEAARPVRLRTAGDGSIVAYGSTSKARQIGPKTLENGDIGDPWVPINVSDKKKGRSAMTLSAEGFTPERLTSLLFKQGFELTKLQKPQLGEGPGWFVASCLARGQGSTEGYHQAVIPMPPKVRSIFSQKDQRDTLAHLAQDLLRDSKEVQRALGTAFTVLTEGAPDKADFDRVAGWIKTIHIQFSKRWEQHYFLTLWRGADENHEVVRGYWVKRLVEIGQALLDEAAQRLPLPNNRHWRAITQAERTWRGILHKKGLPLPSVARESDEQEEIIA